MDLEYVWVRGNSIVPDQLIDISCEQNVEADEDQDRYDKDGDN